MEPYDSIKHYNGAIAALQMLAKKAEKRNDLEDLSRLENVVMAFDVLHLHATTNDVTGFPNIVQRDADVSKIREQRHDPDNLAFYVVAMDLDDFGMFNKDHGQDVGDQVLRNTMGILTNGLREYDIVGKGYHPHGEEIDLILQAPSHEIAGLVVNRLRKDLETKSEELGHKVTGTFGFTPWNLEQEDYTIARVRADDAMKNGKQTAKNKVYFTESPIEK